MMFVLRLIGLNFQELFMICMNIFIYQNIKSNSVWHVKILVLFVLFYLLTCILALFIYTRTIRHFTVELRSFSFWKSFTCVFVLYAQEALLKVTHYINAFDTLSGFRRAINNIRKNLTVFLSNNLVRHNGSKIIAIIFIPSLEPFLYFIHV